jgi:hypothetical protein
MAGVGKTTLAVHAAHRLADRYTDGQLFVDLQAHTAGQRPVPPSDALHALLRQLGIVADRIPLGERERSALWRAELVSRSVLVVLDNAADAEQVRPLLPGATESLILITSRRRLTDLDGAHALSLDVLPAPDAMVLFTSVVGERARDEYAAVGDVLRLCGHLPLAVRIASARLHHRPQWTIAYLADRLRDERRRLAELATAERGVAAAFTLSYQHLPPSQQRMFRLLGLHPGRDVDPYAAAALADVDPADAEADLEQLLDAHMLIQHEPGRYTFHDLLREHARATGAEIDEGQQRHKALNRLLDHYLYTAATAIDVLYPDSKHRRPKVPWSGRAFGAGQAARGWTPNGRTSPLPARSRPSTTGRRTPRAWQPPCTGISTTTFMTPTPASSTWRGWRADCVPAITRRSPEPWPTSAGCRSAAAAIPTRWPTSNTPSSMPSPPATTPPKLGRSTA